MCRYLDAGGYVVGNVRIDSVRGNAAENGMVRKMRRVRASRSSIGRGVSRGPSISGRIKRPEEAYMDKHENEDRWQEDDLHNRMQTV